RRARRARRLDHARARDGRSPKRGVRGGPLLHLVPRAGRDPATGADRMTVSRRQARRQALFLLYQWDVTGQPLASLFEGDADPWARELAEAIAGETEDLDRRITDAAKGWTADRLGAVERNVLRIAVFELDRGEVPAEVAIDEAVSLAKRYATEDAGRLV